MKTGRTLLIAFLASILSIAAGLAALYRGIDKAVEGAFSTRHAEGSPSGSAFNGRSAAKNSKNSSLPNRVTFEPGPKLWDWEVDFEGEDLV